MTIEDLKDYIKDLKLQTSRLEMENAQRTERTERDIATLENIDSLKIEKQHLLDDMGWGKLTDDELEWLMAGNLEKYWHGEYFSTTPSQRQVKLKYAEVTGSEFTLGTSVEGMTNPSGWIDRSGNYYPVDFAEHQKFAREYLLDKYGKEKADEYRKIDTGQLEYYEVLEFKFHWVRVMAWPKTKTKFVMPNKLTHAMKQTLDKYCDMHGDQLPFEDPLFQ